MSDTDRPDEPQGPFFLGPNGPLPLDEFREAITQTVMERNDIDNRIRALFVEELSYEQAQALHVVFEMIANCQRPRAVASYYEGMANFAVVMRRTRGEGPPTTVANLR